MAAQTSSSTSLKTIRNWLVAPPGPPVTLTRPPKGWRICTLLPLVVRALSGMPPLRSMVAIRSVLLP